MDVETSSDQCNVFTKMELAHMLEEEETEATPITQGLDHIFFLMAKSKIHQG
jgi:hypothetical protein